MLQVADMLASSLQSISKRNGLQKYDQMVMNEKCSQRTVVGVEQKSQHDVSASNSEFSTQLKQWVQQENTHFLKT